MLSEVDLLAPRTTTPSPIFSSPLLLRNHLQAGNVSVSLTSTKSRVSPLKDISIAKKSLQSFKI